MEIGSLFCAQHTVRKKKLVQFVQLLEINTLPFVLFKVCTLHSILYI